MAKNICGCNESKHCDCNNIVITKSISSQQAKVNVWNKSGFFGRLMLLLTDNQPRKL